jgi:hypothetical protein
MRREAAKTAVFLQAVALSEAVWPFCLPFVKEL